MNGHGRSISTGVLMVAGAILVLVAVGRPWASLSGPGFIPVSADLGFDELLVKPPLGFYDVRPYLIGVACALGAGAVVLTVLRIGGRSRPWRWPIAVVAILLAALAGLIWAYVEGAMAALDPILNQASAVVPDFLGLNDVGVHAGSGLWLLTIGAVLASIGSLIPGPRRLPHGATQIPLQAAAPPPSPVLPQGPGYGYGRQSAGPSGLPQSGAPTPTPSTVPRAAAAPQPGWYPDPRNPQIWRWFDGRAWTDILRSR